MRNALILLVSAGLSLGLGIGLSSTLPDVSGSPSSNIVTPVTTDTLEYCNRLAREMAATSAPDTARQLTVEGQALCREGQIRGGILRLRRALVMVREGSP